MRGRLGKRRVLRVVGVLVGLGVGLGLFLSPADVKRDGESLSCRTPAIVVALGATPGGDVPTVLHSSCRSESRDQVFGGLLATGVVVFILWRRRARDRWIEATLPETDPAAVQGGSLATADGPPQDPGWSWAIRAGIPGSLFLFPSRRIRRLGDLGALNAIRAVFVSFLVALALLSLVVLILRLDTEDGLSPGPVAAGVIGFGVTMQLFGRLVERPLDGSSPGALIGSYRTRFFLRVAFAEASALAGFVGFILTGHEWVYAAGLVVALVGFARLAPTRRHLERDQVDLNRRGWSRDLIADFTAGVSASPTAPS